jgi:Secretion system C-terminal sorting domain/PKD domain
VIDDNFGYFGTEAFAASGWKNFGPLVGNTNVVANDYFNTTRDSSYLWSYGCGGGSYVSAGGIGSTNDFAVSDLQSVFTMLFGSYFGDWDATNNFLRAPLAQGKTLTSAWSGRPHWQFHHMGLGENIGYSTRLTQNNNTLYFSSYGARFVHLALMGDPTLRNHVVAPVSEVVATKTGNDAEITWEPSTDAVTGYNIYTKSDINPEYKKLNEEPVTGTSFSHSCLFDQGIYTYMVRAVALTQSPSGTYYNLSQGITDTLLNTNSLNVQAEASYQIIGSEVSFTNLSLNATTYEWIFGDGQTSSDANPVHTYLDGAFTAMLIAGNGCATDTFLVDILILTGTEILTDDPNVVVSPNPSTGFFTLSWTDVISERMDVKVYSVSGVKVFEQHDVMNNASIDFSSLADGVYVMQYVTGDRVGLKRIVVQR